MASTTEENPPLEVAGKIQWGNIAKIVAAAIAVLGPALTGAISSYRINKAETETKVAEAKRQAAQAKNASEAGYQVVVPRVEDHEKRLRVLEIAAERAQAKRGHPTRHPIPVVVAPKPAPLPRDLNTAERQIYSKATLPPTSPSLSVPPRAMDAGP